MAKTETIQKPTTIWYKLVANNGSITLKVLSGHSYLVACMRATSFSTPKVFLIDPWRGISNVVASSASIDVTSDDTAGTVTITNRVGGYICVCVLEFIENE